MKNPLADFAKDMRERGHARTIMEFPVIDEEDENEEDEDEDEDDPIPSLGRRTSKK